MASHWIFLCRSLKRLKSALETFGSDAQASSIMECRLQSPGIGPVLAISAATKTSRRRPCLEICSCRAGKRPFGLQKKAHLTHSSQQQPYQVRPAVLPTSQQQLRVGTQRERGKKNRARTQRCLPTTRS